MQRTDIILRLSHVRIVLCIDYQDLAITSLTNLDDRAKEIAEASATTAKFFPPQGGYYYCLVTNYYSGTEQSVASPFYRVVE